MKKYKIIIFLLMFLTIFMPHIITKNFEVYADNVTSEIVLDVKSNRVLYSMNSDIKKPMASTTKILTALCVIENCNIDEEIVIKKETTNIEGSSIYLEEGEKLTIKDLLYGLMLRSGNDCAETLAVHTSGSIERFAELMNSTAKKIGANNSNFVNPHGLHDENHYTTAYDLALISSYAIKNTTFKEICSTKKIKIPFTTRNTYRLLINKNKLLSKVEGATGIKTGFTKKAGRCLVSSVNRDGNELVCVVLNCPPMFERSEELLNNCFNKYSYYKLIESDNVLGFIDIKNSDEKIGYTVKNDIVLPLTSDEYKNLRISFDVPEISDNNIKSETNIGNIYFYCENNLIFSEKIYSI